MNEQTPKDIQYLQNNENTSPSILQTDQFKSELTMVRQSGDIAAISQTEYKIATSIQTIVESFPLGSSILRETLLQDVGINYLKINEDKENGLKSLLLINSDNKVAIMDLISNPNKGVVTDDKISGLKDNGQPITISDIIAFSKQPKSESLEFKLKSLNMVVTRPTEIQKNSILSGLAKRLYEKGYPEKSIEIIHKLINLDPKNPENYYNLGAIIANDPETIFYREAIESLEKFIELTNDDHSIDWTSLVERAKSQLTELQSKRDLNTIRLEGWSTTMEFNKRKKPADPTNQEE